MSRYTLLFLSPLLLSGVGCSPPCAEQTPLAPAPHRLSLSWTPETAAATAEVRYRLDGTRHTVPATPAGDGTVSAILADLPALTEIPYTLWEDGRSVCADTLETDNLSQLPVPTIETSVADAAGGWSRLALVVMGKTYLTAVIDREGRYRWHHIDGSGYGTTEVFAASDGSGLRYNTIDPDREDDAGAIVSVSWGAETTATLDATGMHHAFTPLPDGGAAFLAVDARDWTDPATGEVESVVGDALWEVAADGTRRQVFTLWDHEEPAVHDAWDSRFYPGQRDWSHGNGIFYDEARDRYLVSLGNLDAIYEIDRQTGTPLRRFHPETWTIQGEPYNFPHSPAWTPDGTLLVFSFEGLTAGAREYAVDDETQTLTEVWSRTRPDISLSFLGSATRLAGGNTLINYGAVGWLEEVTPAGKVIWTLSSPISHWFGTMHPVDGLYP